MTIKGRPVSADNPASLAPHVWQAIGDGRLVEHVMDDADQRTRCDQWPFSASTLPSVDPDGEVSEDIWYADHDAPAEYIIQCTICEPAPMDTWCRAHKTLDQCPEHCPRGGGYFHGDSPCEHHPSYGCRQPDGSRMIAP